MYIYIYIYICNCRTPKQKVILRHALPGADSDSEDEDAPDPDKGTVSPLLILSFVDPFLMRSCLVQCPYHYLFISRALFAQETLL